MKCEQNIMGTEDLTVQVLNLSPRATLADLNSFFSYCGTVHKIQLIRAKDQLPYALVTFGQPYAFQTALLLDDATFAGQPIRILPASSVRIPIDSDGDAADETKSQGFMLAGNMSRTRSIEEISKALSEKGRGLMEQTRSAIYNAAEQAAGRMGAAIMNNDYVSTGATCLSDVLDKASKSAQELGIKKKG